MLSNKYSKWYSNIISRAKTRDIAGYTERHHVIPASLGGTRAKDNLVLLTVKEHFVCHRLLARFTEGDDRAKMLRAIWSMSRANIKMKRQLSSRQFEIARKACAEAASLYRHTEESKKKISVAHLGRTRSAEHKKNTGLSSKGRKWSEAAKMSLDKSGANNSRARNWLVTSPSGEITHLRGNFKAWCKQHGLPSGSPALILDGSVMKVGKWAGWKVLR
jgi:hypothetical protein